MQAIRNYLTPLLIKEMTHGATSGAALSSLASAVMDYCRITNSTLSDYYCLRTAKFFDPDQLEKFFNPLLKFVYYLDERLKPFIPDLIPGWLQFPRSRFLQLKHFLPNE